MRKVTLVTLMVVLLIIFNAEFQKAVNALLHRMKGSRDGHSEQNFQDLARLAHKNYGNQIKILARDFGVSYSYLMALITLEVGGIKPAPTRFEKHVYTKLKALRAGERTRYELIKKKTIEDASDSALKNLATSWGAFQIMGYKCVQLGVNVSDIRGSQALYWGVKWIAEEYGHLLKNSRFKDAFHYHNTGRLYPRTGNPMTYHSHYVPNGLKYMEIFEGLS